MVLKITNNQTRMKNYQKGFIEPVFIQKIQYCDLDNLNRYEKSAKRIQLVNNLPLIKNLVRIIS